MHPEPPPIKPVAGIWPNLLPCPFCGSRALEVSAMPRSAVTCQTCRASGPYGLLTTVGGEEARKCAGHLWNYRVRTAVLNPLVRVDAGVQATPGGPLLYGVIGELIWRGEGKVMVRLAEGQLREVNEVDVRIIS